MSAICTVPLMENPTPFNIRKRIMDGILVETANPIKPILIKMLLMISSQILFSRSAIMPQNGRQIRLVMENMPTTNPAKAIVAPRLTKYFDMIVATI